MAAWEGNILPADCIDTRGGYDEGVCRTCFGSLRGDRHGDRNRGRGWRACPSFRILVLLELHVWSGSGKLCKIKITLPNVTVQEWAGVRAFSESTHVFIRRRYHAKWHRRITAVNGQSARQTPAAHLLAKLRVVRIGPHGAEKAAL
jgi:hypothetical protein